MWSTRSCWVVVVFSRYEDTREKPTGKEALPRGGAMLSGSSTGGAMLSLSLAGEAVLSAAIAFNIPRWIDSLLAAQHACEPRIWLAMLKKSCGACCTVNQKEKSENPSAEALLHEKIQLSRAELSPAKSSLTLQMSWAWWVALDNSIVSWTW